MNIWFFLKNRTKEIIWSSSHHIKENFYGQQWQVECGFNWIKLPQKNFWPKTFIADWISERDVSYLEFFVDVCQCCESDIHNLRQLSDDLSELLPLQSVSDSLKLLQVFISSFGVDMTDKEILLLLPWIQGMESWHLIVTRLFWFPLKMRGVYSAVLCM